MKNRAFTLAEVLITLGIIGVVTAMTLPALINKAEKMILKNQFKKAYSNFYNAVLQTQTNLGGNIACYYWTTGQLCKEKCTSTNQYGTCNAWTCVDNSPLPSDQNGPRKDCKIFEDELFFNTLKTITFCSNNALANHCITSDYKGADEIRKEQSSDPDYTPDPNGSWSKKRIQNSNSAYILADGTLIINYEKHGSNVPIYAIDVNGHKRPNQWGKDIFLLQTFGTISDGITEVKAATMSSYPLVKDAITTKEMIENMHK